MRPRSSVSETRTVSPFLIRVPHSARVESRSRIGLVFHDGNFRLSDSKNLPVTASRSRSITANSRVMSSSMNAPLPCVVGLPKPDDRRRQRRVRSNSSGGPGQSRHGTAIGNQSQYRYGSGPARHETDDGACRPPRARRSAAAVVRRCICASSRPGRRNRSAPGAVGIAQPSGSMMPCLRSRLITSLGVLEDFARRNGATRVLAG